METGSLLAKLWDARSRPLYPLPNVGFNATDDLVVTDGALWDPRRGVSLSFCLDGDIFVKNKKNAGYL